MFFRLMGVASQAGLTLIRSLSILQSDTYPPDLRELSRQLEQELNKGNPLYAALEKRAGAFSPHQIAVVRVGEIAGELPKLLVRLADVEEGDWALRAKLRSRLTYPAFLLALAVLGFGLFLPLFIFPNYLKLTEQIKVDPGSAFETVLNFMRWTQTAPFWLLVGGILAVSAVILGSAEQRQRLVRSLASALRWLPGVGPAFAGIAKNDRPELVVAAVVEVVCLKITPLRPLGVLLQAAWVAHFSRMLAIQLGGGVKLTSSIKPSIEASSSAILQSQSSTIMRGLEQGDSFELVLRETQVFPALFAQLVAVAEENGQLEETLEYAAKLYTEMIEDALDRGMSALEPLVMFVIGGVVGSVVLLMLYPIAKVVEQL